MHSPTIYVAIGCTLIVIACGSPIAPVPEAIFPGFLDNAKLIPTEEKGDVVKRRIFEENNDAHELNKISLQALIGGLEQNLFDTASNVGSVSYNDDSVVVPEVRPNTDDHSINKRLIEKHEAENSGKSNIDSTTESGESNEKIVLQTTEKVPERPGQPAHIIIDRISVQPHSSGLPLIPAFQIHHTKLVTATIKESDSDGDGKKTAQIKIIKTDITASSGDITPTLPTVDKSTIAEISKQVGDEHSTVVVAESNPTTVELKATSTDVTGDATSTTTTVTNTQDSDISTTTTTSTTTTSTTKAPIIQLKQAEEELKEKVAEIEAEPVILSARV